MKIGIISMLLVSIVLIYPISCHPETIVMPYPPKTKTWQDDLVDRMQKEQQRQEKQQQRMEDLEFRLLINGFTPINKGEISKEELRKALKEGRLIRTPDGRVWYKGS